MSVTIIDHDQSCQLIFTGRLTCEFSREMEDRIIEALRRYRHVDIDLAAVEEVDLCGLHLLGMLQNIGGEHARIVARSAVVDQASKRLLTSYRSHWLRGNRRDHTSSMSAA